MKTFMVGLFGFLLGVAVAMAMVVVIRSTYPKPIYGDLNGDGKVTATDLVIVKGIILKQMDEID